MDVDLDNLIAMMDLGDFNDGKNSDANSVVAPSEARTMKTMILLLFSIKMEFLMKMKYINTYSSNYTPYFSAGQLSVDDHF